MDISRIQHYSHQLKTIFRSVPSFQKSGTRTKTNSETLKIFRGVCLFILAIFFAWISKTENERAARLQTLHQEWPSQSVFSSIIKQGGWREPPNADYSKLLKYHPDPYDKQPMIWTTDDHCFVYLTYSPYFQANETHLWVCAQRTNPLLKQKWQRLGSGYQGIDKLSQIIAPQLKKVSSYIDPKEIRY